MKFLLVILVTFSAIMGQSGEKNDSLITGKADSVSSRMTEQEREMRIISPFNKNLHRSGLTGLENPGLIQTEYTENPYDYWYSIYIGGSGLKSNLSPQPLNVSGIKLQNRELLNALYRGYLDDMKYADYQKFLGMVQAAGTAAVIYMHLKKYK